MPQSDSVQIGYKLSSEEFTAPQLVRLARAAEEHGFSFALISDHYHPWVDRQGQSPFVWSVLGGIAESTRKLILGTGVTCPTIRIHPAIVAQAAATAATMLPGRFFLGVGSGESLNEQIAGARWPATPVRQAMLEEAIEVIRLLWRGGLQNHHGRYYTVENARVYSLPDQPPPLMVAASGPKGARLAARAGDGLISPGPPVRDVIDAFRDGGGADKPRYGELNVCYDESEDRARQLVKEIWPIAGIPGPLLFELPLPSHIEAAARLVGDAQIAAVPVGPDPERHAEAIRQYLRGGYDRVFVHQIGPNQERFMDFYARDVLPSLSDSLSVTGRGDT
jgi:G6PDH family F420-dependent oxidoreductase